VAIAPEYCTDAIFIFTDDIFFEGAAGRGASFPICCDPLTIRSPSSCFVMYDPRLPLIYLYEAILRRHPPEGDDDVPVPQDCRDRKIRKSGGIASFARRCCTGGGADQGSQWPFAVQMAELTNGRTAHAEPARPASERFTRLRQQPTPAPHRASCGVSID